MAGGLCLGTAQLGMEYGVANLDGRPSGSEARRIIEVAIGAGVDVFDTAQAYGDAEIVLGQCLAPKDHARVRLISKIDPSCDATSLDDLREGITESCRRLRVDQLYGLLLHRTPTREDWPQVCDNMSALREEGRFRRFGISLYEPEAAMRFCDESAVDIIQVPFNALDRRLVDAGFFELARERGKDLFFRSVFLQGLLLMSRHRVRKAGMDWAWSSLSLVHDFCRRHGTDLMTFLLAAPAAIAPSARLIVGVETASQLSEVIEASVSRCVAKELVREWWVGLSRQPDRVVNPPLWWRN